MDREEFRGKVKEHEKAILFFGGIATVLIGKKILEADATKQACTNAMAKVLAAKNETEETFQNMKDDAEDIVFEAKEANKEKICVDITDDEE